MLRADVSAEQLHERQADGLSGHFGLVVARVAEGALDAEFVVEPWMLAPDGFLHAASVPGLADASAEHLGRTTQAGSASVCGPGDRRFAPCRCTQAVPA